MTRSLWIVPLAALTLTRIAAVSTSVYLRYILGRCLDYGRATHVVLAGFLTARSCCYALRARLFSV
jgi:hypothetical protein